MSLTLNPFAVRTRLQVLQVQDVQRGEGSATGADLFHGWLVEVSPLSGQSGGVNGDPPGGGEGGDVTGYP